MDILEFAQPIRSGIYIAALLICVLCVTVVNKTKLPNRAFLVGFLVLKMTIAFCEWLMVHVSNTSSFFLLSLLMMLSFGTAPLLLRFAQGIPTTSQQLPATHFQRWEWGFLITAALLLVPLFLASQVFVKFEVSATFGHFIHWTMSACIILFVAQVSLYWHKAYAIYKLELSRTMAHFSDLRQSSLILLKLLLVLVLANLLFSLIRTCNVWFWQSQFEVTLLANIIEYSVLLACLFFMFHGMLPSGHNTNEVEKTTTAISKKANTKSPKYAKTPLDRDFRETVTKKLNDVPAVTKLALDSTISLAKFSKAISEKPYYVTQVLNQDLHTNFYEFITNHRIQEVMRYLAAPASQTIIEIALAAGFNSKSTFNTAFKKHTGVTPSAYRKTKMASLSEPMKANEGGKGSPH